VGEGGWYRLARKQGRGTYISLVAVKNGKKSLSLLRIEPQITDYLDQRHSHYPNLTTMAQAVKYLSWIPGLICYHHNEISSNDFRKL